MSEQNFSQKDSPGNLPFPSINWINLWQASGNDWKWVVKQSCLSTSRSSNQRKELLNHQKVIFIEIILTIALLLLARYIESSHQFVVNQSQNSNFFESTIIELEPNPKNESLVQ